MTLIKGVAAILLAGASSVAGAADANPLVAEQWRTRPLVVVVPTSRYPLLTDLQAQLRQSDSRDAFQKREMVLFTVVGGQGRRNGQPLTEVQTRELLRALNLKSTARAAVLLIGKDGSVKRSGHGDHIALASLFAVIDSMPMRQR